MQDDLVISNVHQMRKYRKPYKPRYAAFVSFYPLTPFLPSQQSDSQYLTKYYKQSFIYSESFHTTSCGWINHPLSVSHSNKTACHALLLSAAKDFDIIFSIKSHIEVTEKYVGMQCKRNMSWLWPIELAMPAGGVDINKCIGRVHRLVVKTLKLDWPQVDSWRPSKHLVTIQQQANADQESPTIKPKLNVCLVISIY